MKRKYLASLSLILLSGPALATQLIKDQLDSGLDQYLQEIPQCASMVVDKALSVQDGTAWLYEMEGLADFSMLVKIESQRVKSITVEHDHKFSEAMQDMLCVTYSLMRTLQPDLTSPTDTFIEVQSLWARARVKPVKKTYLFNSFSAQSDPVKLTVS